MIPKAFLENNLKIHVLLAALAVASVVAVASLNYLKIQLRLFSIVEKRFHKLAQLYIVSLQPVESGFRSSISDYFVVAVKSRHVEFVALYKKFDSVP